jgi:uncharacterized protein (TIGR01777 family)
MKKLIIAGGTGFLGKALCEYLKNDFDEFVILSRSQNVTNGKIKHQQWDAKTLGTWCKELENATAIINLCGKSVDCRYTEKNKALIFSSRLEPTAIIGEAISKCTNPPKVWINGASATIYAHSLNKRNTENSIEIGTGFSVEVCKAWEKVFNDCITPNTRKVNLRISMVMGNGGGVFPVLKKLSSNLLGGTMGKGNQQVSWVHEDDFCAFVKWIINTQTCTGAYNVVAPNPSTNKEMMRLFRKKVRVPFGLPATQWMLEIGAFFLRTETELILKSRYSYPEKALNEGFVFKHNTMKECLDNL